MCGRVLLFVASTWRQREGRVHCLRGEKGRGWGSSGWLVSCAAIVANCAPCQEMEPLRRRGRLACLMNDSESDPELASAPRCACTSTLPTTANALCADKGLLIVVLLAGGPAAWIGLAGPGFWANRPSFPFEDWPDGLLPSASAEKAHFPRALPASPTKRASACRKS